LRNTTIFYYTYYYHYILHFTQLAGHMIRGVVSINSGIFANLSVALAREAIPKIPISIYKPPETV